MKCSVDLTFLGLTFVTCLITYVAGVFIMDSIRGMAEREVQDWRSEKRAELDEQMNRPEVKAWLAQQGGE